MHHNNSNNVLLNIPMEILSNILMYLDYKSYHNLQTVCIYIYDVCKSDYIHYIKYKTKYLEISNNDKIFKYLGECFKPDNNDFILNHSAVKTNASRFMSYLNDKFIDLIKNKNIKLKMIIPELQPNVKHGELSIITSINSNDIIIFRGTYKYNYRQGLFRFNIDMLMDFINSNNINSNGFIKIRSNNIYGESLYNIDAMFDNNKIVDGLNHTIVNRTRHMGGTIINSYYDHKTIVNDAKSIITRFFTINHISVMVQYITVHRSNIKYLYIFTDYCIRISCNDDYDTIDIINNDTEIPIICYNKKLYHIIRDNLCNCTELNDDNLTHLSKIILDFDLNYDDIPIGDSNAHEKSNSLSYTSPVIY